MVQSICCEISDVCDARVELSTLLSRGDIHVVALRGMFSWNFCAPMRTEISFGIIYPTWLVSVLNDECFTPLDLHCVHDLASLMDSLPLPRRVIYACGAGSGLSGASTPRAVGRG